MLTIFLSEVGGKKRKNRLTFFNVNFLSFGQGRLELY